VVCLSLALCVMGSGVPLMAQATGPGPAAIDRPLRDFRAQHPHNAVQVIVQSRRAADALQAVRQVGGRQTTALPRIGGLAASISADQLDRLAGQPGITHIALDPPMHAVFDKPDTASGPASVVPPSVGAPTAWVSGANGSGVAIAVLDSGVQPHRSLGSPSRLLLSTRFNAQALNAADQYGHGTWVAGIAAGDGIGVATGAGIVNLKISDDTGAAHASDVLQALAWVIDNRAAYHIRVVNLSFVSSLAEGYATNLLDAAVEMVWHSGVVVVVSAGNLGPNSVQFAPANDPYVITVGAADDQGTPSQLDDTLAWFSSFGLTQDGFGKPDVTAPGRHVIGPLASSGSALAAEFPSRVVDHQYIQLSGTSAAAPVVSGAAALLAQARPSLSPDQVKWLLVHTARPLPGSVAGELDVASALAFQGDVPRANTGLVPNQLVGLAYLNATGNSSVSWDSVSWDSVSWDSVSWDSVSWDSVSWDSVSWDSTTSDTVIGND
jgi:serine protease AprX